MLVSVKVVQLVNLILWHYVFNGRVARAQSDNFQPIFMQNENTIRKLKGKEVLNYMNLSVNPCQDFYEYACGNWINFQRSFPSGKGRTPTELSPELLLERKLSTDLQIMLEEQVTAEDGNTGRLIKDFYQSCLAAERNGQSQQAFFSDVIQANGGFPAVPGSNWLSKHYEYNWQQIVGQLRYSYGMDILIGLEIDINHLNTYDNSIYLKEPTTIIPDDLCSDEGTKRINLYQLEYETIEDEVAKNLKMWLTMPIDEAKKIAIDLVAFEYELCTFTRTKTAQHNTTAYRNYARKTLNELTVQFNNSIDFDRFGTVSIGTPIYKPVFMASEDYYSNLVRTVNASSKTTIANYIMYRALSTLSFPINDHPSNRPFFCMDIIKRYFPRAVGEMYQRMYPNTAAQSEVQAIFEKLKDAFHNSLGSSWIEEATSRVGKKKLSEIKLYFPTYEKIVFNRLKIERNDYWNNLAHTMAYVQREQVSRLFGIGQTYPRDEIEAYDIGLKYRPIHKRIDIGSGLLHEPFYQNHYPHSLKYATIGQKLARELATAFDDLSWTSDFLGLSNWDRRTANEYRNRSECFRRQISNYLYNHPHTFKNYTRLRELIATSSGLNLAFNSYLNWLNFMSPNNDFSLLSRETLPELNLTNTQLFFILFAQVHCGHQRLIEQSPIIISPLQRHNLERYEVNGPLMNFIEFARDFSCPAGAEMNVADKCIIY